VEFSEIKKNQNLEKRDKEIKNENEKQPEGCSCICDINCKHCADQFELEKNPCTENICTNEEEREFVKKEFTAYKRVKQEERNQRMWKKVETGKTPLPPLPYR
jgi:hypothetical protein